jgi:hypothetical protein
LTVASVNSQLRLQTSAGYYWDIERNGADGKFNIIDQDDIKRFTIDDATGFVGIGTTTPFAQLSVHSVSADNSPLFVVASTTPNQVATTTAFIIDNNGNVGIGTGVPGALLEVNGSLSNYDDASPTTYELARIQNTDNSGGAGLQMLVGDAASYILGLRDSSGAGRGDIAFITETTDGTREEKMRIKYSGNVGIGTTTPEYLLSVDGDMQVFQGGLCVDDGTWTCPTNLTDGTIYAETTGISEIDLAENYPTRDETLEAGEIVSIDMENPGYVTKTEQSYDSKIVGVISTKPGVLLGGICKNNDCSMNIPVALAGRVPVKVNLDSGPIKIGDPLTSASTTSGYAMKATQKGRIIGFALEEFNETSTSTIMVFVNTEWNGTELTVEQDEKELVIGEYDKIVLRNENGEKVYLTLDGEGFVVVDGIRAQVIETEQLCVGGVCINKEQLQQLLEDSGEAPVAPIVIEKPTEEPTEEEPAEEEPVVEDKSEEEPVEEIVEEPAEEMIEEPVEEELETVEELIEE